MLTKLIYHKWNARAVRLGDQLLLQINFQLIAFVCLNLVEERGNNSLIQHNGEQAILETVIKEDIGEAWRQNSPKAVVIKGPGSVLSTRAAAKIVFSLARFYP